MLHGTSFPRDEFDLDENNPSSGAFDICFTEDGSIAKMYATRFGAGFVYEFDLAHNLNIADEDTVRDLLGLEPWSTPSEVRHEVDSSRQVFVDAGYDGITYTDQLPGTAEKFECTRIYNREAVVGICGVEEV